MDAKTLNTAASPPRAPVAPAGLLPLLMAMTAIGPLTLNILIPAVPNLVVTMSTDASTVQLTLSLYLVGLAFSQLALGPLSDRFGRRPVVIAGLALTAVASVAALAASSIYGLIAARVAQALGASTGLVIGRAIVRDLYERDRAASVIGLVTTVMVVAPMISPLIGGLLDTVLGWQSIFVFIAVMSFAVLGWSVMALPETRPAHVTGGGFGYLVSETRSLLSDSAFNGYVLVASLGTATFFAFLGGAPHLVIGTMGQTSAEYGLWFIIIAFGYMLGNLLAAKLSPRFGVDTMIRTGAAMQIVGGALCVAAALAVPDGGPAIVFFPQFFVSLGNGIFLPNAIAGAISARPQSAGTASGIAGFAQMGLGAVTAQIMGGVLEHSSSAQPLAWAMLALSIASFVSFALLIARKPAIRP